MTGRSRRFAVLAIVALGVFLGAELLLDLTSWGQRWDDLALLEARLLPESLRNAGDSLLRVIRIPSILVLLIACLVIAAARRQLLTGAVIVIAFGAAIISAEAVKFLTPRPDLAPKLTLLVDNAGSNTFPSGHVTIATGLSLALVFVVAPQWRAWVAAMGMVVTTLIACSAIIAGWHRPSDAIGGVALATAWMSLAGWLLVVLHPREPACASTRIMLMAGAAWSAAAVVTVTVTAFVLPGEFLLAFASAGCVIVAVTVCAFLLFIRSMGGETATSPTLR